MSHVIVNDKKLVRGSMPIIYLSGRHGTSAEYETVWLKKTGCKYRCFSYAYVCPGAFYYRKRTHDALNVCIRNKSHIMMDSSAHSFHNFLRSHGSGPTSKISAKKTKKKYLSEDIEGLRDKTIDMYVEYVKANHKHWDFYCNFDYVKHCPTIYKIQTELESRGIYPVPSYHGDDSLDWLRRYIDDGHKLIGLGMSADFPTWRHKMRFYDRVFNLTEKHGVFVHGFAVTSLSMMFSFPWFSVDSSTWVKVAAFGHVITVDPVRKVIGQVHISDRESKNNMRSYNRMQPETKKQIREGIEALGFDFDLMRKDITERCTYNGYIFSHMEELKLRGTIERVKWGSLI